MAAKSRAISGAGRIFIFVFLVVVFEGTARKWISSSLTLPLIATRDILAVGLIFYAWRSGQMRHFKLLTPILTVWSCCFLIWGLIQIILGENSPLVFLIGARFWLLYIWFGCAAAATMTEADYRASVLLAAGLLLILAPLTVLQFYSPPGARINAQVDSDDSNVFLLIAGIVRPTATFSFTAGYTTLLALITPFVFMVVDSNKKSKFQYLIAVAIFVSFAVGSIVSGSRAAVIYSGALFSAYLLGRLLFSNKKTKWRTLFSIIFLLLSISLLLFLFQGAIDATQQRFQDAAAGENFWARLLVIFTGESGVYSKFNWLGYGFGSGSNLAAYAATGHREFTLTESEAGRILLEAGLLGYVWTFMKIIAIAYGFTMSWRLAAKRYLIYPLLIWITLALALLTWSSIGQLTSNALLGILIALGIASLKYYNIDLFQEPKRSSNTQKSWRRRVSVP